MSKSIKIFLLLLCTISLQAQYGIIDSLQSSLIENSTDSIKVNVYQRLGQLYGPLSVDTAIFYKELAEDISIRNEWPVEQIESLIGMGFTHYDFGDQQKGLNYFETAYQLAEAINDTFNLADASNGIGLIYWKRNENYIAISHLQKAMDWAEQTGNFRAYNAVINNLGMINDELGRHKQAIEYFEKCIDLSEKRKDWKGVAIAYLNIGVSYEQQKMYDKSIEYFQKVLDLKDLFYEKPLTALTYVNIANVYNEQGKPEEALKYCNSSLSISEKYDFHEFRLFAETEKSIAYLKLNRFEEAIASTTKALSDADFLGVSKVIPDLQKTLSESYQGIGNYKEALLWQQKHGLFQDSLYKAKREQEIARLEISHQTEQKEAENRKLKSEKEYQAETLKQRTFVAIVSSVGLLLFVFLAALLFRTKNKLKSTNLNLEKIVDDRTKALQESNIELQQSNEELKRFAFIASHDLKEPLRGMGGFISLMKRKLQLNDYESMKEYITFIEKSNYQMVELVDNILAYSQLEQKKKLKKELIDIQSIIDDVNDLSSNALSSKKVIISSGSLPKIHCNPFLIKIVIKNIIENGLKYNESEEPTVHISAEQTETQLKLHFKDNGIGIPKEYQEKIFGMFTRLNNRSQYTGSGMGLAFCKKMLDNNNGTISIESEIGKGSTFTVCINTEVLLESEESEVVELSA